MKLVLIKNKVGLLQYIIIDSPNNHHESICQQKVIKTALQNAIFSTNTSISTKNVDFWAILQHTDYHYFIKMFVYLCYQSLYFYAEKQRFLAFIAYNFSSLTIWVTAVTYIISELTYIVIGVTHIIMRKNSVFEPTNTIIWSISFLIWDFFPKFFVGNFQNKWLSSTTISYEQETIVRH